GLGTPEGEIRDEEYFDAASKTHIVSTAEFNTRYMLSMVLKYQLLKAMCDSAGIQYNHLLDCNLDGIPKATEKYREMLSKGRSVNWRTLLRETSKAIDGAGFAKSITLAVGRRDQQTLSSVCPGKLRNWTSDITCDPQTISDFIDLIDECYIGFVPLFENIRYRTIDIYFNYTGMTLEMANKYGGFIYSHVKPFLENWQYLIPRCHDRIDDEALQRR
ncbi:uncharacterized protein LOC142358209, partial [Convolutriloba macropyga]|uniref:uncharacterized protein LOC142358209 n=1 Tax=Convolutriloba macropyga TaxID=536237 RepID=UPI003F51C582